MESGIVAFFPKWSFTSIFLRLQGLGTVFYCNCSFHSCPKTDLNATSVPFLWKGILKRELTVTDCLQEGFLPLFHLVFSLCLRGPQIPQDVYKAAAVCFASLELLLCVSPTCPSSRSMTPMDIHPKPSIFKWGFCREVMWQRNTISDPDSEKQLSTCLNLSLFGKALCMFLNSFLIRDSFWTWRLWLFCLPILRSMGLMKGWHWVHPTCSWDVRINFSEVNEFVFTTAFHC